MSTERPSVSTVQVPASSVQLHASDPLTASTVPPTPLFVAHHVPEDPVGSAKEAMLQAGFMMDQMKVVHEASKPAYVASSSLQINVKVS